MPASACEIIVIASSWVTGVGCLAESERLTRVLERGGHDLDGFGIEHTIPQKWRDRHGSTQRLNNFFRQVQFRDESKIPILAGRRPSVPRGSYVTGPASET